MKSSIPSPRPRSGVAACAVAAVALAIPAGAIAAPASVNLRIEGSNSTVFEAPVTTDGHVVQPATGDKRLCDGTNGGANPEPGPTPTTALDDGARTGGFPWDGRYFDSFNDYLVSQIGPDRSTSSQFFGQYVNSVPSEVGGCQQIVKTGDEVLWAFDAFSKEHVLRLEGPAAGRTNAPLTVKVTDGGDGTPLAGATVGQKQTGADGTTQLTFPRPGIYDLKAERSDSVRSNLVKVCVDDPGVESCTSTDRSAPAVKIHAPRYASDQSTTRTFTVSWEGLEEAAGSGITGYSVDVRRVGETAWRSVTRGDLLTERAFRGSSGVSYEVRVLAVDRAGNRSAGVTATTTVPLVNRDGPLFSDGWERLERRGAWGGSVRRSTEPGALARFRFSGQSVALIGRRLRKGGKLRVSVAGRTELIDVSGEPRPREVLWTSAALPPGTHTLELKAVRGPVEVDAVAVVPR